MNVTISGRHMDVTDALRNHVNSGLEKIKNHFDRVIDVDVILSVEKHSQIAEFNLHANGLRINAQDATEDMYVAIDNALTKLERQVSKHKDRIMRHQPRTARESRSYAHQVIQVGQFESDNGQPTPAEAHHVVSRVTRVIEEMSVDEAAFQLELTDDLFLVFTNADTAQVNVLYARDDGTYGLIAPEV